MAGPVGHQRSGKGARVQVEGGNLRMARYDCTERGDKLDTSNFEGNGVVQSTIGLLALEWSVAGPWDASTNPTQDPPGLYPRDNLGQLSIFTSVSDNVFYSIPQSIVVSARTSAEVRGLVSFDGSGESNGSGWSTPVGNA